ncbi:MAG: type VI secretion system protein TssA [Paraburkholderia sp.]|jgi:type VI secretion system protein ImpA|uniref:type VI secretion system protein TssA n=1 Tax=Burkholderiaceae TaxID=119060 RepID=UPI0010F87BC4|nr:type VI secretion system protein TssA [Burkholderia sp. 4M9327F10]
MTSYDLSRLLTPIDDASPSGDDLEYDPAFVELERIAAPTTERSIGDNVKPAREPDWDRVALAAQALLGRTKDVRAAIHLSAAWTRLRGLSGWCDGLALVRGLLEPYWDSVHPQLDADDNNDPTARANAVMPLGDPQAVLGYFRTAPFVQSPRLGRFSLRDLRIANGAISVAPPADGSALPTMADLEACCMDCPDDQLPAAAAALAEALEHAQAIDTLLAGKLGTAAPDLSHLSGDIHELKRFVDTQLSKRFPDFTANHTVESAAQDSDAHASPEAGVQHHDIRGGEDVIRRIDEICEYYDRHEPSSPLPILLRRARRLVGKSFTDVLRNIAPGGLSELQMLSGPDDE